MASSSEAFARFSTWKKDKTSLRVNVIVNGETTDVLKGSIFAVDPEASQVGIVLGMQNFRGLDVGGADFTVESTRVVVTRNELDWLVFEELS